MSRRLQSQSDADARYNSKRPNLPGRCESFEQKERFKAFQREYNVSLAELIEIAIKSFENS